jgi:two-component system sensor histidine kinase BaeS
MHRVGCLFALVLLLAVGAGAAIVWTIGAAFGAISAGPFGQLGLFVSVAIGLLLLAGAARAFRSIARPVGELVEAAGRVEEGDYSARVPVRGPGDVRSLARAFNDMSARLEETDRRRRASLADISHELRTPLTVIQGQLEAVIDGVYPADAEHLAPILAQVRTLDGLIEDLRTLTLVDSGTLALHREPVDLAVLISDTVSSLRPTAEARGVTVTTDVPAGLPVLEADPVRLRSVVSNLVTNAIRLTPADGRVLVTVAADPADASVLVRVHDTGPGFPPDLLPRVFERFVRAADSSGSGLGLAIARDLVTAHGGTIEARNEDGGATVEFRLPVAGLTPA